MEITDVRIKLSTKKGNRVKAFATITLDNSFVVRDMRIIEGRSGLFIAMPSRPLKEPCPKCGYRNPVRGKYCSGCGGELTVNVRADMDDKSLHRDVAHPITQEMRDYIHNKIIEAYKLELEKGGSEPTSAPSEPPSAPEEEKKAPEMQEVDSEEKKLSQKQKQKQKERRKSRMPNNS